jgi:hypothetical protein
MLGAAGLAAGAGAAWLAANRSFVPYQTAGVLFCLLMGWSFVGCGLVAWRQRPRNRLGTVMIFAGFAWFATFLTDARDPLLFTVGTAVQSLYLAGFATGWPYPKATATRLSRAGRSRQHRRGRRPVSQRRAGTADPTPALRLPRSAGGLTSGWREGPKLSDGFRGGPRSGTTATRRQPDGVEQDAKRCRLASGPM